jgi:hypothetical protein
MADMWKETGYANQPAIFTMTETPTAILILIILGSMVLIRNNMKALKYAHYFILLGFIITGLSSWMFVNHIMSAFTWLSLTGLGLYMTYIPFNCIFFERLIAGFRYPGNVGFLIYVADSFGYLASVCVLVTKEIAHVKLLWTSFYSHGVMILSIIGIGLTIFSLTYFSAKHKRLETQHG